MGGYVAKTAAAVTTDAPGGNSLVQIIDAGGLLPDGVSVQDLNHLLTMGLIEPAGEPVVEAPVAVVVPVVDVGGMTVAELKAYADAHDINIDGLTAKADIAAVVSEFEAEQSE